MHFRAKPLVRDLTVAVTAALMASPVFAAGAATGGDEMQRWGTNMTQGVTAVSREIYDLHMAIFWVCVIIGVVVFGVMFWSILMHRKSAGVTPSTFHESVKLEILWTAAPIVILIGMAIPSTATLFKIYDTSEADLDIKITGYQWKWQYEYLGEDVSFFSNLRTSQDEIYNRADKGEHYLLEVDEPLVIPTNKKVRFLITAADVIHAWWIPEFAVKRDAIPGFMNEAWAIVEEEGVYRGQCAELCGKDHGFMPIVVIAKNEADYNAWLAERKAEAAKIKELTSKTFTMDELYARGETVYQSYCGACHGANGEGGVGPAMVGSAYTTGSMEAHLD
ncbi:cytochrome c oxidase subunit II, partial [bacterium]|nr:cytochrome c oxidase subunit II [bacterium]